MEQIARSATQESWGHLNRCRYVLDDRDAKFCPSFRSVLPEVGVNTVSLPPRSPNLNTFPERWVRSIKEECLSRLILVGEGSLSPTLAEFSAHYHGE
jgi:putative transposase